MEYRRISADCHIDLCWLPADLFTSEAKASLKDRMPFVTEDRRGLYWTCRNGGNLGLKNGVGPSGAAYVPGQHARVDAMAATNLYADGAKGISRIADPELRLKDMEQDGVDAEVIYGILGIAGRLEDPEAANEMMRVYNDWLVDFCSHYPDRQIGLACLPYGDIDAAVAEVHRAAKLGLKGVELSCSWDMQPMWHTCWEPLWQAVNDVDLPIHFHTFPNVDPEIIKNAPAERRRSVFFSIVTGFQLHLVDIIAALMSANVFERYPNFRVVFGESGIGWIPYVLDRMDFEWEDRFQDLGLKMKPSEYWKRQCRGTFQFDRIGSKLVEDMGIESLMWGSDYPHGDGVWPESSKYIDEQFAHLNPEQTKRIICDNAKEFYRL